MTEWYHHQVVMSFSALHCRRVDAEAAGIEYLLDSRRPCLQALAGKRRDSDGPQEVECGLD